MHFQVDLQKQVGFGQTSVVKMFQQDVAGKSTMIEKSKRC
jgi:hypothetical protein